VYKALPLPGVLCLILSGTEAHGGLLGESGLAAMLLMAAYGGTRHAEALLDGA
jgi:hypothetical protein